MNISKNFTKKLVLLCISGILLSGPQFSLGQTTVRMAHNPPGCVTVGLPVVLSATIHAATPIQDARIYFRIRETAPFYFIPMVHQHGALYTGTLPAPVQPRSVIEYFILGADSQANASKSQAFYTIAYTASECPDARATDADTDIIVYAEQDTPAELGFAGDRVQWETTNFSGTRYFAEKARFTSSQENRSPSQEETPAPEKTEPVSQKKTSPFSALNNKMIIGVGAGLGVLTTAAVVTVMTLKEEEEKVDWTTQITDPVKNVGVEIFKIPDVQTACGTMVMNQLYVANNRTESLTISTIDYEVVLTKDEPEGSCSPGRLGTFVPNWTTTVQPGERVLVREWFNTVNPCSNCPYLIAECEWTSRYIVHTSAGSAAAETTFRVEGDLCAASIRKSSGRCAPIQGDIQP
jgi:hypothetical protein